MTTYSAVLEAALTLPLSEREVLAETLLESLEASRGQDQTASPLSEEWRAEIARRTAAYERGEVTPIPWEQVRENILRKHGDNIKTEIDRRSAEIDASTAKFYSWEETKLHAHASVGRGTQSSIEAGPKS